MSGGLPAQGIESVCIYVRIVAKQQNQNGQADGGLSRSNRHDEKHKNLPMHVTQIMGESDKIHIDTQQH